MQEPVEAFAKELKCVHVEVQRVGCCPRRLMLVIATCRPKESKRFEKFAEIQAELTKAYVAMALHVSLCCVALRCVALEV